MKPRDLTNEEKRLWREATRRDKKLRPVIEEEVPAVEPAPPSKKSAPMPVTHKKSPPKKPAQPPKILGVREVKRLLRSYPDVEATLDLHGMSRTEAFVAVQGFVAVAQRRHLRHLLIVTGKGRTGEGVLKTALPHWLSEPPLAQEIIALAPASIEKGGSGALHVIVRRRKG